MLSVCIYYSLYFINSISSKFYLKANSSTSIFFSDEINS